MEKHNKTRIYFIAACLFLSLSNCKKVRDMEQPPFLNPDIVNAMYPLTQTYIEGMQTFTYKYEYDNDNHLTKYTRGDVVSWNIGSNQVDATVYYYASSNHELYQISTTSYVYTLVGLPNTSVNIYNSAPTQVAYTYYDKDIKSGVVKSRPGGVSVFYNNDNGLPFKILDNNTTNHNYTYDENKNLTKAEFVRLSGPRANAVFSRVTLLSFDDKPSPFSAVKGYWPISYPQSDNWDYALAFCKHNPKQTITEVYDDTKNAFVVHETDDYTYEYNDKGYPTRITIDITYNGAVTTHSSRVYTYTYK